MAPQHPLGKHINKLMATNRKKAAEIAFKAMYTQPRTKPSEEERMILATSIPTWDEIGKDKLAIRTYVFAPTTTTSQPVETVLLSHGHARAANSMLQFVPALVSAGFQIVAIDHNAHGESAGDMWDMQLCVETMEVLMKKYAPLHGVIAHSVGGTVTAAALIANPEIQCPRLVCFEPPLQVATIVYFTLAVLGVDRTFKDEIYRLAAEKGWNVPEDLKDKMATEGVHERTKVLVVHDFNDKTALFEESEWLASRFKQSRIQRTRGLKHYGCLSDKATISIGTKFMIDDTKTVDEIVSSRL